MSSGRSLYQRRPERYAREKKHFQRLIYKLKRPSPETRLHQEPERDPARSIEYLPLSVVEWVFSLGQTKNY
jgi:hypothetical protein